MAIPAKLAGASVEYGSFWYYCGNGVVIMSAGFVLNQYILKKGIDMISKKSVMQGLKQLPDHFSVDDLLDRLLLIEKVEIGLQQSNDQETVSTKEARKKLEKWLG